MGYDQHPQPTLSSEASWGSGLPYPARSWGKQQVALTYPLCEAGGGREHSHPTAASTVPQGPQFNQRRAGTPPRVIRNASSLVDAALRVTQPHHVKATFVTRLPWLTGLGSSCNPKASPHSQPHHCAHGSGPQKQGPRQEKGSRGP